MRISKKKVNDGPDFCFCCGKVLDKDEYVLNLGTSGSTFELCRGCLRAIKNKAECILDDGRKGKGGTSYEERRNHDS